LYTYNLQSWHLLPYPCKLLIYKLKNAVDLAIENPLQLGTRKPYLPLNDSEGLVCITIESWHLKLVYRDIPRWTPKHTLN